MRFSETLIAAIAACALATSASAVTLPKAAVTAGARTSAKVIGKGYIYPDSGNKLLFAQASTTKPPCADMISETTARPTPAPPDLVV